MLLVTGGTYSVPVNQIDYLLLYCLTALCANKRLKRIYTTLFSQHWHDYSCAEHWSGAERAVLPFRVPISVIFAHRSALRSALLRSIFFDSRLPLCSRKFLDRSVPVPSAHTNSPHHCKSEHSQLYITLLQISYSIRLPKIMKIWLFVDKVIAKITGWRLLFWDIV